MCLRTELGHAGPAARRGQPPTHGAYAEFFSLQEPFRTRRRRTAWLRPSGDCQSTPALECSGRWSALAEAVIGSAFLTFVIDLGDPLQGRPLSDLGHTRLHAHSRCTQNDGPRAPAAKPQREGPSEACLRASLARGCYFGMLTSIRAQPPRPHTHAASRIARRSSRFSTRNLVSGASRGGWRPARRGGSCMYSNNALLTV